MYVKVIYVQVSSTSAWATGHIFVKFTMAELRQTLLGYFQPLLPIIKPTPFKAINWIYGYHKPQHTFKLNLTYGFFPSLMLLSHFAFSHIEQLHSLPYTRP
jgi:hypothetical protein